MSEYCHNHKLYEDANIMSLSNNPGPMNIGGMGAVGFPSNFNGAADGSGDKAPTLLPLAMQVAAQTIGLDLVPVVPMAGPMGLLSYLDFVYEGGRLDTIGTAPSYIKSATTDGAGTYDGYTIAVVGTSSLRRKAQLLAFRSDLKVIEFRGNVQTRLRKLKEKVADATFLACAGLNRLLMQDLIKPIPIKQMLPAVAQGVIGIENRIGNKTISDLIEPLNDKKTAIQMTVERSFLAVLDGSCRTPIGGHAIIKEEEIFFHGEILKPDGSIVHKDVWSGSISDSKMIGESAGQILKEKGGKNFFG